MKFQAAKHNADNSFGDFDQTPSTAVSFGTDGTPAPWTITVSVVTFAHQQQLVWGWAGNNQIGSTPDATAQVNTVVDGRRTYVLADLPKAIATSANLQVTLAGVEPVLVPFTDALPAMDRTFAGYAFSEPGQYSAQIVAADGAVLATWPPS
jgi:hypothetical protein